MNISLTLQRDLKQSLTMLALLFIKHYYEWQDHCVFLSLSEKF